MLEWNICECIKFKLTSESIIYLNNYLYFFKYNAEEHKNVNNVNIKLYLHYMRRLFNNFKSKYSRTFFI